MSCTSDKEKVRFVDLDAAGTFAGMYWHPRLQVPHAMRLLRRRYDHYSDLCVGVGHRTPGAITRTRARLSLGDVYALAGSYCGLQPFPAGIRCHSLVFAYALALRPTGEGY